MRDTNDEDLPRNEDFLAWIRAPQQRRDIQKADIIVGLNGADGAEVLFYAADWVKDMAKIVGQEVEPRDAAILRIPYDSRNDSLEALAAALIEERGRCDYGTAPPGILPGQHRQ